MTVQVAKGASAARELCIAFLRTPAVACLMALGLVVSCTQSDDLDGHLFVSGVKDFSGKTIGLAIDFVPNDSEADLSHVRIAIDAQNAKLVADGRVVKVGCLGLPVSGRITLPSATGELTSDARVRVEALRSDETVTDDTLFDAAAGSPGSEIKPLCAGVAIDDAIWPTVGASVPAPPASGGTSAGGTSAGGTSAGGVGGGAPEGGAAGVAGGGAGGSGGADEFGAGAAGAAGQ